MARLCSLLVSLLLCWGLSACSGASPTSAAHAGTPTPTSAAQPQTCVALSPVSAPLITRAGLQRAFALPGSPFASVATHDGDWIFVSLQSSTARDNGIAVLRQQESSLALKAIIALPGVPAGLTLTSDERYLLVADGKGVAILGAARAEAGAENALLRSISDGSNPGTIEVALSRDDQYVFATDEAGQTLSVINLQKTLTGSAVDAGYVGRVPLDLGPVGLALAPDNRYLYVTTEYSTQDASLLLRQRNRATLQIPGTLTVVDVARAEHDPAHAVVGSALAGCTPVRVALSAAGDVAWVTARGGDEALAFNTTLLLKDPAQALVASVAVGPAPVGLALIRQDTELIVADSNRLAGGDSPQTLTLINVKQALAGQPALLGSVAVGSFPRELALDGQTLLLTNYTSATLSQIALSKLP